MANNNITQFQLLRGDSASNDAYTGRPGELTANMTDYSLRLHDGVTPGGYRITGGGAGGGVVSVTAGTGLTATPNPITSTGTISLASSITASLYGTSSWAQSSSVSISSSYANVATSASYAQTSSFAISSSRAITASFSVTASAATSITFIPNTASFATTASAATSITFTPATASFSTTASFATTSSFSTTASFAQTSSRTVSASRADSAAQIDVIGGGSTTATGIYSGSFSGSLSGIATSASYAVTASYALNAGGSGTGFPFSGSAVITGSLIISSSGLTLIGSGLTGSISGSLTGTASFATSASFAPVGPGTTQSIALFNSANTISSSVIFQSGSNIGIGTTTPAGRLTISGTTTGSLLINTNNPNDNNQPYSMVLGIPQNSPYTGGGFMISNNQAEDGTEAFLSVINSNLTNGTNTKTAGYFFTNASASSHQTRQQAAGNLVAMTSPRGSNLTLTNQNLYFNHQDANSTSGDYVNSQAYLYAQFNTITTRVNQYTGYLSRGQIATAGPTLATITDFQAGPYVGIANGTITTRYGLLIDFTTASITNAYGVFQSQTGLINHFAGNVGIGTTNPLEKLDVRGKIYVNNGGGLYIDSVAGYATLAVPDSRYFIVETNSTERLRVTATGNVGVGTTNPIAKLQIQGDVSASSYTSSINNAVGFFGTSSWSVSASRANSSAQVDVLGGGSTTALGIYSGSFFGTSSWAVSASNALTASFALNAAGFPFSGSAVITGSLLISSSGITLVGSGLTGSVFGTSSWANNATSASFSTTASFSVTSSRSTSSSRADSAAQIDVLGGGSTTALGIYSGSLFGTSSFANTASFALNATPGFPFSGNAVITGSLLISSSGIFLSGSGLTGSVLGTSSWAQNAVSSSFATTSSAATSITFIPTTSSFAATSSFATTASFAPVGPGTTNSIALFNSTNTVSSSLIVQSGDSIGIGTATTVEKVTISSGSILLDNNYGIRMRNNASTVETVLGITTANNISVASPTIGGSIQYSIRSNSGVHQFLANGAEVARISNSGNMGIGTPAPSARLHVSGSQIIDGTLNVLDSGSNTFVLSVGYNTRSTPSTYVRVNASASTFRGYMIQTNGNNRWLMYADNSAETAINNGGSIYNISAYDDAGTFIDSPLQILRNSGSLMYLNRPVRVTTGSNTTTSISPAAGYGITFPTATNIGFVINSSEAMRIDSSANVGIGTTTAGAKLHVQGNISASSYTSSINNAVGFLGTASWAQNAVSASFAVTSSRSTSSSRADSAAQVDVIDGGSTTATGIYSGSFFGTASYATTASYALNAGGAGAGFPFSGSAIITGSLLISGSGITLVGGGLTGSISGSLVGTASFATSASFAPVGPGTVNSVALFNSSNTVSSSVIFQSGTSIGIGTTGPTNTLQVQGNVSASSYTSSISNAVGFFGTASWAQSASRATSVAPNSVALGTDTTGNYVGTVTQGRGITVSGTAGEGSTHTITLGSSSINTVSANISGAGSWFTVARRTNASTGRGISEVYIHGAGGDAAPSVLKVLWNVDWAGTGSIRINNYTGNLNINNIRSTYTGSTGVSELEVQSTTNANHTIYVTVTDFSVASGNTTPIVTASANLPATVTVPVGYFYDGAIFSNTSANVGIGTTSPDANLTVQGQASFNSGSLANPGIAARGDLNTGIYFPTTDTIGFVEGGVEAMRIDSSGNVGIGITSPVNKLQVQGNVSASSFTSSISNAVGFFGTASWANNAVTASFATTASYSVTSSFTTTASFAVTSSRTTSASRADSTAQVDVIDGGSTTALGTYSGSFSGSGNITSASYALTASYALNAGGTSGVGFPFSGSAIITGSLLISGSGLSMIGMGVTASGIIVTSSFGQLFATSSASLNGGISRSFTDTGLFSNQIGNHAVYEMHLAWNPNRQGHPNYRHVVIGDIIVMTNWNGTDVTSYIGYNERYALSSGSITVRTGSVDVLWVSSSGEERRDCPVNSSTNQIRIKYDGFTLNNPEQNLRLTRKL